MYIRAISRAALLCSTILSFNAFAAGDRVDYDLDDDGLIEINDLADLNEIRNHLDGAALYGDSTGCPEGGCNGFELTTDLDFDTNGDGQMNEQDTYWNDGQGWEPIGANSLNPFTTNFHGNGHQVRNLYIDRTGNAGLFGYIAGYETQPIRISEVVLTGPMTSITGGYDTGIFAGAILDAKVDRLFISGTVNGGRHVGGLAGRTLNSTVSNVFSSAVILVGYDKGGIIGRLKNADLSNSLATGYIEGRGGLLGAGFYDSNEFLYWATDTTGQPTSSGTNASYFGALLSELQCPVTPNDDACTENGILYENWDSEAWDFGSDRQLPGLIMNGVVYRDSDGDGALDEDDAYPDTFAASLDTDKDGYPDNYSRGCSSTCVVESGLFLDAFPENSAGWLDADLDGLLDKWADGCDTTCQTNSGLSYDDYPDDRDNDVITDVADTDDNNDGIIDADADSDGLIDIASLEELNAIRFAMDGSGQAMIEGSLPDTSGCPIILWQGIAQQRCHGYELVADLDFDTNGDGQMNELDNYWNDGEGWEPIGSSYSSAFNANFHGNGHQIRNLYIDRSDDAGLFGYILGVRGDLSTITEVAITGPLTSVTGSPDAGLLASRVGYAEIDRVFISGGVSAPSYAGGLAGYISQSTIYNVFSSASIMTRNIQGGLIGHLSNSTLSNSLSTGYLEGGGGLLGYSNKDHTAHLYWATDTSGQATSTGSNTTYFGALLNELQCPTSSDNNTCTNTGTLYESWSSEVWDFGTDQQLPGLIMGGRIYRDSDGDGVSDEDDAFPNIFAASRDADKDGYPESYSRGCSATCAVASGLLPDAFPENSAGWLDTDLDGLVDKWADGCDITCQTNSGLSYDDYPNDHDNDGITDAIDTDDNNDGTIDADIDSDGLIDVASLEELNAIRFSLDGSGQRLGELGDTDSSGCPGLIYEGLLEQRCAGYELVADLDFDTNSDGQMNELDNYWNNGEGWEPIGVNSLNPFTTNFHGNGHQIRNLYIDRTGNAGLFDHIEGTSRQPVKITQIVLNGPMTLITGNSDAGLLASRINYAEVDRVFVTGVVNAEWDAGGLAGDVSNSAVSNVFSSAAILMGNTQGGLIGRLYGSILANSLSTGYVATGYGLLRFSTFNDNSYLYWATDTGDQETSADTNASYFGALLSELQCPTAPNDDSCTDKGTLYENWDSEVWDFGSDRQLPGLIMNGVVYRDSDGDGTLDVNYSPTIELLLTQDGREENTIVEGMGDVTIEVIITDENGWDYHSVEWSSNDINLADSYEFGNSITFSSDGLVAGDYTISATVTDSGIPQLSDTAEMTIRVLSNVDPAPAASSGGGGSGGGAIFWLLALLSAPLLIGRVRA
jgi:hypothetical protein